MTPPSGLSSGMDPFALDTGTAQRLLTGAVDAGDAPPEYRAVARVLHELRSAPDVEEWAGEPAAVETIAAAVVVRRHPQSTRRARRPGRSSSRATRLAVAAALAAGVCLTGGLASAGSLPAPAQSAASRVLGTVGISVPGGGGEPAGVEGPSAPTSPAPASQTRPDRGAAPTNGDSPASSSPGPTGKDQGTPAHGSPPGDAKGHGNGHTRNGNDHTSNGSPQNGDGNGNGR